MIPAAATIRIRILTADDAATFQALRLLALEDAPTAFGSSTQEESGLDLEAVAARIVPAPDDGAMFGAFDGAKLAGMVGLGRQHGVKRRHKALLWSMYIAAPYRGMGLGRRIVLSALDYARGMSGVRRVDLTVNAANLPAIALYRALGFTPYGVEPQALFVAGTYHDESLMTKGMAMSLEKRLQYVAVGEPDFDALADVRIAAMRDSLERVGRFDADRARGRLRESYAPPHTWAITLDGVRVGFYALRPNDEALHLEHLYILPGHQGLGVGGAVMQRIAQQADSLRQPVTVGALRDSPANAFYQRHGFLKTGEDTWDIYYERPCRG
jgi:GNAT superfamily N-acetyltransferase